ncbi:MAG: hypothetical protein H6958_10750 [Chromatiaceae bacterium]|nr:hypothetical protein [Chromatiaceae bacterium]
MAEAARPKPLKATPKIRKVTVKMPTQHKDRLPTQILADGYNMRQKSKWVSEAVESLLANPHWEGALVSEKVVKPDAVDVFSIPAELMTKVNREARRINAAHPSLNANQSTIIRAAIARRMLGFFTPPKV